MNEVHVTDHAILRYLERVLGFNVEPIRKKIVSAVGAAAAAGASKVSVDGFTYLISSGRVTSVVPSDSPRAATLNGVRSHGSSFKRPPNNRREAHKRGRREKRTRP